MYGHVTLLESPCRHTKKLIIFLQLYSFSLFLPEQNSDGNSVKREAALTFIWWILE